MTPIGIVILWLSLIVFVLLTIWAIIHIVKGLRLAHGDRPSIVITAIFVLLYMAIIGGAGLLISKTDWSQPWSNNVLTTATDL